MNYTLLKQIIAYCEEYEQESIKEDSEINAIGFSSWLNKKLAGSETLTERMDLSPEQILEQGETVESMICKLAVYVSRYTNVYARKALEPTPIRSYSDYAFLLGLYYMGELTKMQLIDLNIQEKTSGMEVIKRLIEKKLIEQYDDTHDRRSKRLMITEAGKAAVLGCASDMMKVGKVISANLDQGEKMQLLYLLNKLHNFHRPIFFGERSSEIDEIIDNYIEGNTHKK